MNKSSLTVLKGVSTVLGGAIAGPTGALIGNLTGSLLQSFLPEAPEAVKGFTQDLINDLVKGLGKKAFSELKPEEQQLVNHDLQTAFRDAFIQAVYDIGGKTCFPVVWRKNPRIISQSVIYSESTGHALWVNNDPLKKQVQDCLKELVKAVEVGKVLPLDPPIQLPANDVRSYLESTSPEQLSDAFFDQVLHPFLNSYKSLLVELPDLLTHLKRHLLDRTLVYLGENLKKRTPAWRAYNRMVLEQYRSQLTDLGKGQEEISKRIDNLLKSGSQGGPDLSNGLADLLSAVGSMEKKLDEQFNTIVSRVVEQHRELVQSLEQLTTTSVRIESKVDRVLRILEDGHFVVEGTPPVAADISPEPGDAPFQGMQFFDEKDADRFFGREKLVAKLAGRLCSTSFLAVVGASGSGKSSLVRAGLLPAMRSGKPLADSTLPPEGCKDWQIHLITPGEHPLETLAVSLTSGEDSLLAASKLQDDLRQDTRSLSLAIRRISQGKSPKHKILLVIDQFEELFTLCRDETERQAFLKNLISAISPENVGPLKVVITLRADFYDECGRYPQLRTLLQENQEYIGPMSLEELRSAIEEPARQGNWEFERGLVDLILRDVGEEPGALPLLSHALLETWNHRRGRMMTLESYAEAGGVRGAIAQTAETVYQKRLTVEQQTIARSLFLRLTELGEGTQDTRRRVALSELATETGKQAEIESVMTALVDARLIMTTEDSVEVAHEALIREWPLLRSWLTEDRETLRLADGVRVAAREWQQGEKDSSLLNHRGGRLEEALELLKNGGYSFNKNETEYLQASKNSVERERQEREQFRQRLTLVSITVAIMMLLLGIWGLNRAQEATKQASTAIAERDRAEELRSISRSRQLAAEAINILDQFPVRSLLLSIESFRYTSSRQAKAEESLRSVLNAVGGKPLPEYQSAYKLAISKNGERVVAILIGNKIQVWDIQNPDPKPFVLIDQISESTPFFYNIVELSPNGHWLTVSCKDNTIRYWDLQNPDKGPVIIRIKNLVTVLSITLSFNGRWMVAEGLLGGKQLLDMQNPSFEPMSLNGDQILPTFSPDENWLITYEASNKTIYLRNLKNPNFEPTTFHGWELLDGNFLPNLFVFSPDCHWLVAISGNNTILWDILNPLSKPFFLNGHYEGVQSLVFSPDSLKLATGSSDSKTRVWNLKDLTKEPLVFIGHKRPITALTFTTDGNWLATGSKDKSVRIWNIQSPEAEPNILRGSESEITSLAFSPNDRWLIAEDRNNLLVRMWDTQNLENESIKLSGEDQVYSVAFSFNGQMLASGGNNSIRLWNIKNPKSEPKVLHGHDGEVTSLAFSPDGHWLASGSRDKTIRLWGINNQENEPIVLRGHLDTISALAFTSDGHVLISASSDGVIRLWNTQDFDAESIVLITSEKPIRNFEISKDNRWIAIKSYNDPVIILDMSNQPLSGIHLDWYNENEYKIALNYNGHLLATGSSNKEVRLWDLQNIGKDSIILFGHDGGVQTLAFSPDGNWLATGSDDETVRIWDVHNSSSESVVLHGHEGSITTLEFSTDGQWLATGSDDQSLRLWNLDQNSLIEKACIIAGRNLSLEEWKQYFPDEEYHMTCPLIP